MCSHHIASLLYITGHQEAGTVPEYYLQYCREIEWWGNQFHLNVAEAQFVFWVWYRLAYHGSKDEQREHRRRFERDARVRRRRAMRISRSLKVIDKLGFARFFVDSDDPTLAAIIAWRDSRSKRDPSSTTPESAALTPTT